MLFNTLEFAVFFAITFAVYYLPWVQRLQVPILIGASLFFYAWSVPWLLVLLVVTVLTNAVTSYQVGRSPSFENSHKRARAWSLSGVVFNLAILGFFKYAGLLLGFGADLLKLPHEGTIGFLMVLPLPLGISFYTFEGISLLIDTWKATEPNAKTANFLEPKFLPHLAKTSLFIVFFPHLISGPILKARQFYPQVGPKLFRDINWDVVISAAIVGFFLKSVVADNLKDQTASLSYPIFLTRSSLMNVIVLYGYSIQIFADFAGYSLIAISLGALFGYHLPANFNFPYISRSLAEFWRRWHISLSTWLRDYLYFPLGGNRKGAARTYFNLAIVMVLGGLWHGAAWSYAFWGAFHGLGLALERLLGFATDGGDDVVAQPKPWLDIVRVLLIFGFVTFGWLFFKLPKIDQAFGFVRAVLHFTHEVDVTQMFAVLLYSLPVVIYHARHLPHVSAWRHRAKNNSPVSYYSARNLVLAGMIFLIFTNGGSVGQFIYFQF